LELFDRFKAGDRRALARAITWVENGAPEAAELIRHTYPLTGRAHVIGITGPPGAGKSTLVDRIAGALRREGKSVGISAVDPTSPFSGGAILGDRIRMQRTLADPGVFMRSLATRGHLGGLSLATGDVIGLLDAFGFAIILVETVGAGQSEVEIMELAHTTCVVLTPGAGDEVQAIKAGILEIGDVFAVNKADREGADRTVTELEMMLDLGHMGQAGLNRWPLDSPLSAPSDSPLSAPAGMERLDRFGHHSAAEQAGASTARSASAHAAARHGSALPGELSWRPPVVKTVAKDDQGTADLVRRLLEHGAFLAETGRMQQLRLQEARAKLKELVTARVTRTVMQRAQAEWDATVEQVAERQLDPYAAADALIRKYLP
jgi:LAO/AO transport system kinase